MWLQRADSTGAVILSKAKQHQHCHPEQSEGSKDIDGFIASEEILRCTQNDRDAKNVGAGSARQSRHYCIVAHNVLNNRTTDNINKEKPWKKKE